MGTGARRGVFARRVVGLETSEERPCELRHAVTRKPRDRVLARNETGPGFVAVDVSPVASAAVIAVPRVSGEHDLQEVGMRADARFDRMLARCAELTCAKQPIVERSTGVVVGYTGVDWIEFEEQRWLEWGYRLVPPARGNGYAIEASVALLNVAANEYSGEILGIIHLDNQASKNVVRKMGFKYWMQAPVQGEVRAVYRLRLGTDPHRGVSAGVVLAGQKRTQTSIGTPR